MSQHQLRTTDVREKIQEMVRRIVARFHPLKIVLFGSHARGTAGPDSDVDLLIIMEVKGSKRETQVQIRMELNGMGVAKDVVVATPSEVKKYGDLIGTILGPALQDGEILHER